MEGVRKNETIERRADGVPAGPEVLAGTFRRPSDHYESPTAKPAESDSNRFSEEFKAYDVMQDIVSRGTTGLFLTDISFALF